MSRRVGVVQLVPRDTIGGVEIAARTMAARDALDCDFHLQFIAGEPRGPVSSRMSGTGIASLFDPRAHVAALRAVLARHPDVLICSLWWSVPIALLIKRMRPRLHLVLFLHAERTVHLIDALLARIALRCADEIWADSRATLARRVPAGARGRVISFVIDRLTPVATEAAPEARFVTWGRIAHQKGIDRAMRLIALLRTLGIDARFDIWGSDDGEEAGLRALVATLGIGDAVAFRGPARREDLPAIAAGAGFFLLLSRFEGMAMSTVEAMQLGLVPVVTPVGQMADYVKAGENGVLVSAEDPAGAAAMIAALITDPAAYRRLRTGAIAHWQGAQLYADEVCAAAVALAGGGAGR